MIIIKYIILYDHVRIVIYYHVILITRVYPKASGLIR